MTYYSEALDELLLGLTPPDGTLSRYRRARVQEDLSGQPHRLYLLRTAGITPGTLVPRMTYDASLILYLQPSGDAILDDTRLHEEAAYLTRAIRDQQTWPVGTSGVFVDGVALDVDEDGGSLVATLSLRFEIQEV